MSSQRSDGTPPENPVLNQLFQLEPTSAELGDLARLRSPVDAMFRQGAARPAEIIKRLSEFRRDPLVPSSVWRSLAEIAEVTSVPVHTLFLECRLHGSTERTDFGFGLTRRPEIASWASQLQARSSLGSGWRRVAAFLESWVTTGSPWSRDVPLLFLAFDRDGAAAPLAPPCVSLCVDAHLLARRDEPDDPPPADAGQVLELVRRSHLELTGSELPGASRERLLQFATGDGVELRHVSFMLSRPSAPTKLDVRLPLPLLSDYLERQHWPNAEAVTAALSELGPFGGHVQLNLPLAPHPAHRLEIEVFAGRVQASREERFRFLERLVECRLAASGKVRVLRAIHEQPLIQLSASTLLGANFYVKLCFEEGQLRETKAYVGWMPKVLPELMAPAFRW